MFKHATNGLAWRSGVGFRVFGIAGVGTPMLATPPSGVQRQRGC
jgi:hypothetical protein